MRLESPCTMAATLREIMIDAVLQCVEGDWLLKLCCHFCHMLVVCVVKPYKTVQTRFIHRML